MNHQERSRSRQKTTKRLALRRWHRGSYYHAYPDTQTPIRLASGTSHMSFLPDDCLIQSQDDEYCRVRYRFFGHSQCDAAGVTCDSHYQRIQRFFNEAKFQLNASMLEKRHDGLCISSLLPGPVNPSIIASIVPILVSRGGRSCKLGCFTRFRSRAPGRQLLKRIAIGICWNKCLTPTRLVFPAFGWPNINSGSSSRIPVHPTFRWAQSVRSPRTFVWASLSLCRPCIIPCILQHASPHSIF